MLRLRRHRGGRVSGDASKYVELTTSQYRDKPKFTAMVEGVAQPFADTAEFLEGFAALFDLDTADGPQLDAIGLWIGASRDLEIPISNVYFSFDTPGLGFDEGLWNGAPTEYVTAATSYDGVADFYRRSAAFDDAPVAARSIVLSAFFNVGAVSTGAGTFFAQTFGSIIHYDTFSPPTLDEPYVFSNMYDDADYVGATETLRLFIGAAASGVSPPFVAVDVPIPDLSDGWHSVIAAVDLQTGEYSIYLDDVLMPTDGSGYTNVSQVPFTVDATEQLEWNLGMRHFIRDTPPLDSSAGYFPGCISEVWFDLTETEAPDFSVTANRRLFVSADNKPVNKGFDGSLPFGSRPIFYSTFGNGSNSGYGGDFDAVGAPGVCVSSPSPGQTYNTTATNYDGATDYYRRESAIDDVPSATRSLVVTGWFNVGAQVPNDGSFFQQIIGSVIHYTSISPVVIPEPYLAVSMYDDSGYVGATDALRFLVSVVKNGSSYITVDMKMQDISDGWHSFVAEVDCETGDSSIYVDDEPLEDDGLVTSSGVPFTADFTIPEEWSVAERHTIIDSLAFDSESWFLAGCLSEVWLDLTTDAIPDFSVEANRRKFVSADLNPVYPGPHGEYPFGSMPAIYLPSGNGTNRGYAGDLAPVGTPAACTTSPGPAEIDYIVGLGDEAYRTLLRARILRNHWDGTIEGAYEIWDTVFDGTGYELFIIDHQDMSMTLGLLYEGTIDAVTLALFTGGYLTVKPAGVRIRDYIVASGMPPIFALDQEGDTFAGLDEGSWAESVFS